MKPPVRAAYAATARTNLGPAMAGPAGQVSASSAAVLRESAAGASGEVGFVAPLAEAEERMPAVGAAVVLRGREQLEVGGAVVGLVPVQVVDVLVAAKRPVKENLHDQAVHVAGSVVDLEADVAARVGPVAFSSSQQPPDSAVAAGQTSRCAGQRATAEGAWPIARGERPRRQGRLRACR